MIYLQKCPNCSIKYEISWDDSIEYYNKSVEDSDYDLDYDNISVLFCPFCGTHVDGGLDDDYDDIFKD